MGEADSEFEQGACEQGKRRYRKNNKEHRKDSITQTLPKTLYEVIREQQPKNELERIYISDGKY